MRDYQRAQDEALTKKQLLEQTLKDLEYELEAKSHLKDDRGRLVKQMEVCGPPGRPGPAESGRGTRGKQPPCADLSLRGVCAFYSLNQPDIRKAVSYLLYVP